MRDSHGLGGTEVRGVNRLHALNPSRAVAALYPRDLARALQEAVNWPQAASVRRIDALTDEAAANGLARPRWDDSGWQPASVRIPTIGSMQA